MLKCIKKRALNYSQSSLWILHYILESYTHYHSKNLFSPG